MGCYGIGVSHVLATICETYCDADGICWSLNVAPYHVSIVYTDRQENNAAVLYNKLIKNGIKTVLDDHKVSFGTKIKDGKLFGIPYLIIIGNSYNNDNLYEVENHINGEKTQMSFEQIITTMQNIRKLYDRRSDF